jgi:hypothetical protein
VPDIQVQIRSGKSSANIAAVRTVPETHGFEWLLWRGVCQTVLIWIT